MNWFSGYLELRPAGSNGWGDPTHRIQCSFPEAQDILDSHDGDFEAVYFPSTIGMKKNTP